MINRPSEDNQQEIIKILVVDGDKTIRRSIAAMLNAEGYTTDCAENGKEAIEKSKYNFFNLVVINVQLSDMMGTHAISQMKETVPPMIKVIISGYAGLPKAVDAVNDGADACILIPTEPAKLLSVIKRGLKKQMDAKMYGEERIASFIETRLRQLSSHKMPETVIS